MQKARFFVQLQFLIDYQYPSIRDRTIKYTKECGIILKILFDQSIQMRKNLASMLFHVGQTEHVIVVSVNPNKCVRRELYTGPC